MPVTNPQQILPVTDFSPGIYQYSVGGLPITSPPSAPVGSASFAVRCINKPGIGLVPFYGYDPHISPTWTLPTGNSPGVHPWSKFTMTGIATISGVAQKVPTGTTAGQFQPMPAQMFPYDDFLAVTMLGMDNNNALYTGGRAFLSDNGSTSTPFNFADCWPNPAGGSGFSTSTAVPYVCTWSFDVSMQLISAGFYSAYIFAFCPGLYSMTLGGNQPYSLPGVLAGNHTTFGLCDPTPFVPSSGIACFASTNRLCYVAPPNGIQLDDDTSASSVGDDLFIYTDPPAQGPVASSVPGILAGGAIVYTIDGGGGFGAWGSVSTGELILIRRNTGAVVVYQDSAFPSTVVKLPAVKGTGAIMQKMVMSGAGAVYVTEDDGVYAWNGNNTSQKVSNQIPNGVCLRQEMEPNGFDTVHNRGFVGPRQWNDVLNGLVFFPNNWVFDSLNGNWWQCEDPSVTNYGAFSAGQGSPLMYATPAPSTSSGSFAPGAAITTKAFNANTLASSWKWTSNPIPAPTPGVIATLLSVEIHATNPTATACTFVVTPTVPPGYTSTFGNNPQPQTYTVPPNTAGFRQSLPFGFNEYNFCIQIVAQNTNASNPGPILHGMYLGFGNIRNTGGF